MKYVRYFMVLRLASAMLVLSMAFFTGCRSTRQPVDLAPIDKVVLRSLKFLMIVRLWRIIFVLNAARFQQR